MLSIYQHEVDTMASFQNHLFSRNGMSLCLASPSSGTRQSRVGNENFRMKAENIEMRVVDTATRSLSRYVLLCPTFPAHHASSYEHFAPTLAIHSITFLSDMATSSTAPGLEAHNGDEESLARLVGSVRIDADVSAGQGESDVDLSEDGGDDDPNPPTYEIGDYVPPEPNDLSPLDDDSTSNASTAASSNVANAVADAIRSLVPTVIEQLTPVIRDAVREEMAAEVEERYRRREELKEEVRSLGTRLDVMNTKMDDLRAELVDAVNTSTLATKAKFDDLYLSMTKCFGYVDTRMDTLQHAVDTGEHAVKDAIKVHESSTTSASDRSTTLILKEIEKGNRELQKQVHTIQDKTDKQLEKLCASVDKLGKDGIKLPAVLKELSKIGNQIGEHIKQQTSQAKENTEAATVVQEAILEKISSFKSAVILLDSKVSLHERYLFESQQSNESCRQLTSNASVVIQDKAVKLESWFLGAVGRLQTALTSIESHVNNNDRASQALVVRLDLLTTTIQDNMRSDLNRLQEYWKVDSVREETTRKIVQQEAKKHGAHALFINTKTKREARKITMIVDCRHKGYTKPDQSVFIAAHCRTVWDFLKTLWEAHCKEPLPSKLEELEEQCRGTKIVVEESVWDVTDQVSLEIGSKDAAPVYAAWFERNVNHGFLDYLKVDVDLKR